MKRVPASLAIIFLICVSSLAQSQNSKTVAPGKIEQQILALNRAWADAMVRGDTATLDRLFDDDMIVTSGDGSIRDKAGELKDTGPSEEIKTYFFNTEDVRVRVYGEAAVVTGRAKWRINYKGRDVDHERRYMSVYAKRNGRWRMVAMQITRIAQPQ
jgi:ketosteroid isomerase-like protein